MRTRRSLAMFAAAAVVTSLGASASLAAAAPIAHADDPAASGSLDNLAIDVRPDDNLSDDVAEFGPTMGSETAVTGADAWHAAGIDGSGIKIGVIDFFDVTK